jgi:hypothetical protein
MSLVKFIEFLRQRLKAVVWTCAAALALLVVADILFVGKDEAHSELERRLPAFWAIFGFLGCALIVMVSKAYGHAGIMTREDYYEQPAETGTEEDTSSHSSRGTTHE